ncbi:uncharacterized protein LOC109863049 [Pseudomyrmex gracilis]|uniref:uncharacterized protein LOC109863049 n=1 Tax=Pseudomyrmex gracilis TaxID=219809 RepID=UPI0009955C85|nr:uncharacterized protein LOC109863049 [Pseudomyrmex gracilis]
MHGFLVGTGLTILNRRNEPTFLDSRRQEVIDITVCTKKVAGLVNDWRVSDEPSGSDHRQIRLTLQQLPQISWWNKELENLRLKTRRKFSKAKRTRLAAHWEAFRSSQREYSKEIKKAKYKSWKHFCESIESAPEASRLHRILCFDYRPQLGCLKLPTGNVTEEASDTLKYLMEIHFPGFDNNIQPRRPKPRVYKPREWRLAAEVVHLKGVEWAIKTFNPYKAPGPDGIYPVLLQKGLGVLVGPLTKIFKASIALRHVPKAYNGTRVVFIPKPGRNGYISAKDFRPISLPFFVLKTEGRSTDTLHHFVSGVEKQLEAKGYVLGVFLDIEGAFDST